MSIIYDRIEYLNKHFIFRLYQLHQNYMTGFGEGTPEYGLGYVMMHDVKFNDYVYGSD